MACCSPVPLHVKQELHLLHQIINTARDQPLIKRSNNVPDIGLLTLEGATSQLNKMNAIKAMLRSSLKISFKIIMKSIIISVSLFKLIDFVIYFIRISFNTFMTLICCWQWMYFSRRFFSFKRNFVLLSFHLFRCHLDFSSTKYNEEIRDIVTQNVNRKVSLDNVTIKRCDGLFSGEVYTIGEDNEKEDELLTKVMTKLEDWATPYECYRIALMEQSSKAKIEVLLH